MKQIRYLVLLMCLAVTATAWANLINENKARTIAARFMASHAIPSTSLRTAYKAPLQNAATSDQAAFYVFNNAGQGFVIVTGDDRAPAVLGYSDKGAFDANNVPEALQELLKSYAVQIDALSTGGQTIKLNSSGEAISPLVTAMWSQNSPTTPCFPCSTMANRQ